MSATAWCIAGLAVSTLLYAVAVVVLMAAGRRGDARALAGFVPDCALLLGALLRDSRVPRRHKLLLALAAAYLALPFDLVPDFIPVAGHLDDAIFVAVALRSLLRTGGEGLVREHWRGPERSLLLVQRLASGR